MALTKPQVESLLALSVDILESVLPSLKRENEYLRKVWILFLFFSLMLQNKIKGISKVFTLDSIEEIRNSEICKQSQRMNSLILRVMSHLPEHKNDASDLLEKLEKVCDLFLFCSLLKS